MRTPFSHRLVQVQRFPPFILLSALSGAYGWNLESLVFFYMYVVVVDGSTLCFPVILSRRRPRRRAFHCENAKALSSFNCSLLVLYLCGAPFTSTTLSGPLAALFLKVKLRSLKFDKTEKIMKLTLAELLLQRTPSFRFSLHPLRWGSPATPPQEKERRLIQLSYVEFYASKLNCIIVYEITY